MEFRMVCSSWADSDDEKVIEVLQQTDKKITPEELSELSGVPLRKVLKTLRHIQTQIILSKEREAFLKSLDN